MNDEVQGLPSRPADGEAPVQTETTTTVVVNNDPITVQPDDTQAPSMWPMFLLYGAVFAAMWFFLIRPQRNREKKMKELQSAITVGNEVVTTGGLIGKVAEIREDRFIVEFGTNKGVLIPVRKTDVLPWSKSE